MNVDEYMSLPGADGQVDEPPPNGPRAGVPFLPRISPGATPVDSSAFPQLANLTGRPAISAPVNWTDDRLPLGVQFVGSLGSDGALLQLAAQLEEARPWIQRFPAYTA